jgi:primosomal protein N''
MELFKGLEAYHLIGTHGSFVLFGERRGLLVDLTNGLNGILSVRVVRRFSMSRQLYTRVLSEALVADIATLKIQLEQAIQNQSVEAFPEQSRLITKGSTVTPAAREIVEEIDRRISRLEQVRDWIDEDEYLAHLIDSVIGKQVKTSEQRQARKNIIMNIVFLLLGWLLSILATPANIVSLFPH